MLFNNKIDELALPYARLQLHYDFLSARELDGLFSYLYECIAWRQDSMLIARRMQKIPRLQAWYGEFAYSYSGIALTPLAWTQPLLKIKERIGSLGYYFNTMLANLYRDGNDSVNWHADDEKMLGAQAVIASYSLGAVRRFEIKPKQQFKTAHQPLLKKYSLDLPANSLLIMQAPMQNYWLHRLSKQQQISAPRINLTFRRVYH